MLEEEVDQALGCRSYERAEDRRGYRNGAETHRVTTSVGTRELGLFIPKGAHFVVPAISELVEDADSDLPDVLRPHPRDACSEIRELKDKCAGIEHELKALAKQLPEVQRLLTIPGIGLLTATAIVGFVGDLRRFPSGRRFSSYLGLVPKENSSGDIRVLPPLSVGGAAPTLVSRALHTPSMVSGRKVADLWPISKGPGFGTGRDSPAYLTGESAAASCLESSFAAS